MDTIQSYIDNVFSTLPKNKELESLKEDILNNMEDKYLALKEEGKSENEAIGIVISEFGNIDELISELGINLNEGNDESASLPTLEKKELVSFLSNKKKINLLNAIGVFLFISSNAVYLLLSQLAQDNLILSNTSRNLTNVIIMIPTLLVIALAVALILYSSFNYKKYRYIRNREFNLSFESKEYLKNSFNEFKPKFILILIIGVSLFILSPIVLYTGETLNQSNITYFRSLTTLIVALAVFLFVYFGAYNKTLNSLSKEVNSNLQSRERNKVLYLVSSTVWKLAVCAYLISGFVFNNWSTSWIIFPIVGILLAAFRSIYKTIKAVPSH